MNKHTKDNAEESEFIAYTNQSSIKQKEYSKPTIVNIGKINKLTLNGISNPINDSGAFFTS